MIVAVIGGISVTCTFSNIYGCIIKGILEEEFKDVLSEKQAEFGAGQSTAHNLYCIMHLTEKRFRSTSKHPFSICGS
jgi:hypothetical protein